MTVAGLCPTGHIYGVRATLLVDREKRLSCEHGMETLSLFGESFETIADSQESTVLFSETNRLIYQVSLSDRLTQSLITAGLVRGIIPLSMRDASGQLTLDVVLKSPDGGNVEEPKAVW
jgi:hypothetical protein